jgi:hypothetical protein
MSSATSLVSGASASIALRAHVSPRAVSADVVALLGSRSDDARPSRVGGAPLAGAQAVSAYQRTAAIDSVAVLSRIDERA